MNVLCRKMFMLWVLEGLPIIYIRSRKNKILQHVQFGTEFDSVNYSNDNFPNCFLEIY
mgnify:FL=1